MFRPFEIEKDALLPASVVRFSWERVTLHPLGDAGRVEVSQESAAGFLQLRHTFPPVVLHTGLLSGVNLLLGWSDDEFTPPRNIVLNPRRNAMSIAWMNES